MLCCGNLLLGFGSNLAGFSHHLVRLSPRSLHFAVRSLIDLVGHGLCRVSLMLQLQGDGRVNADCHMVQMEMVFDIDLMELVVILSMVERASMSRSIS